MTNEQIAARLREIATNVHEHGLTGSSEKLLGIAASLEAQSAGDAGMPVVATEYVCKRPGRVSVYASVDDTGQEHRDEKWSTVEAYPLVRQRDAQAAIATRDARIASAERYSEIGKLFMNYYVSLITVGVTYEERDVEWETLKVAAQACLSGGAMRSTP